MENKILIVESDAEVREQVDSILQEIVAEGAELLFASSSEEGRALFKSEHPQLVLLDPKWENEWKDIAFEPLTKPVQPDRILAACRRALGQGGTCPLLPT